MQAATHVVSSGWNQLIHLLNKPQAICMYVLGLTVLEMLTCRIVWTEFPLLVLFGHNMEDKRSQCPVHLVQDLFVHLPDCALDNVLDTGVLRQGHWHSLYIKTKK